MSPIRLPAELLTVMPLAYLVRQTGFGSQAHVWRDNIYSGSARARLFQPLKVSDG